MIVIAIAISGAVRAVTIGPGVPAVLIDGAFSTEITAASHRVPLCDTVFVSNALVRVGTVLWAALDAFSML